MNGLASDFAGRRAGAEVSADIRIGVTNEGIYRITRAALTNAGVPASALTGSVLRLFCRTQEVAITVSSTGLWTTNDYLLFAASGFDGYYTTTNVYWLGFGPGGARMASRSATPFGAVSDVTSYRQQALHYVKYDYEDLYRPDDTSFDHWFDPYPIFDTSEQTNALPTDQVVTNTQSQFDAVLYGVGVSGGPTHPDHCTRVRINGTNVIGQFFYDGEVTVHVSTNFAGSLLKGTNMVEFEQIVQGGVSGLRALLGWFSITYTRSLAQQSNALLFNGRSGTNNYFVSGFTNSANVYAFDISNPAKAVMLTGCQVTNTGAGAYAVRFGDNAATTSRYAVCQGSGIADVSSVQRAFFRDLASTNRQADYIVICPYAFRDQVYRLLKLRYAQGLSVAVAPLPDIYNEFSYGIADAAAIKEFIGHAFHHWKAPPKYVLLAGAGTYDPRHYRPDWPRPDILPVHMGPGFQVWTALDGWYATVQGSDNVPDVAIGRIPIETDDELKNVVDKAVAFEGVPSNHWWRTSALLVAGTNEPGLSFTSASEALAGGVFKTNGFTVDRVYQGDPTYGLNATQTIKDDINTGEFLVNFFGHGAINQWSSAPPLLVTNDVYALNNSFYPIVAMLTCVNGSFQSPTVKCMVEVFMERANHGAAACVAASGLTTLFGSQVVADGLYGDMLTHHEPRIGDAMMAGYANLYLRSGNTTELLFFELFGDPAMKVNSP